MPLLGESWKDDMIDVALNESSHIPEEAKSTWDRLGEVRPKVLNGSPDEPVIAPNS